MGVILALSVYLKKIIFVIVILDTRLLFSFQMQVAAVFSDKLSLVICQNFSGGNNLNSLLNLIFFLK